MTEKEQKKNDVPELVVQRRKTGRGSSRRILRARDALDAALSEFSKEIGREAFLVDDKGDRAGDHPLIEAAQEFRAHMISSVSDILA
jgi:hypothetical protein